MKRGLSRVRASGRLWSPKQVLPPGARLSLKNHSAKLEELHEDPRGPFLSDLNQTPEFMGPAITGVAPALLRRSKVWSFKHQRLILPVEKFELMGHNIWGNGGLQNMNPSESSLFVNALRDLSDHRQSLLAGNTMHVRAIGLCMMYALACTVAS